MTVAKLYDNSLHGYELPNGNIVNVVSDCNDNYIVSLTVINWILIELPETQFEEIDFSPIITEVETE